MPRLSSLKNLHSYDSVCRQIRTPFHLLSTLTAAATSINANPPHLSSHHLLQLALKLTDSRCSMKRMNGENGTSRYNNECYICGKTGHYARYCWYKKKFPEGKAVTSKEMGSTSSPIKEEAEGGKRDKMITQMASWKLSQDVTSGKKGHFTRYCWREKKSVVGKKEREEDEGENRDRMLRQMALWRLPQDITSDILSRLHVKSVMRCRCVCKAWRDLINSSHFISTHLARSSQPKNLSLLLNTIDYTTIRGPVPVINIDYKLYLIEHMLELGVTEQPIVRLQIPTYRFTASCNGLFCLSSYDCNDNVPVLIYNPHTRETLELPKHNFTSESINAICGFGYHARTKEYKVLSFLHLCLSDDSYKLIAEVYTLGSSTWRSKGEVPFMVMWRRFNVLVNGALHWLARYPVDSDDVVISSFDIENEEFHVRPIPPHIRLMDKWQDKHIQELGGLLSFVDFSSGNQIDIWLMKHYGVEESWNKQFVVPIPELVESVSLLWHLEGGEILLHYNYVKFIYYDPNNNQIRYVNVQGYDSRRGTPDTRAALEAKTIYSSVHVGSLVSPRLPA